MHSDTSLTSRSHFASWQYSHIASANPSPKKCIIYNGFPEALRQWNSPRPISSLEFSRGKRSAMAWLPGLWDGWVGGWMWF